MAGHGALTCGLEIEEDKPRRAVLQLLQDRFRQRPLVISSGAGHALAVCWAAAAAAGRAVPHVCSWGCRPGASTG